MGGNSKLQMMIECTFPKGMNGAESKGEIERHESSGASGKSTMQKKESPIEVHESLDFTRS